MTVALDLFAGTGWAVACQRLGIEEYGVEIMPEAQATRAANGMTTAYGDVWTGLDDSIDMIRVSNYDLLIASPPCQTFSMAGKGAGREALDHVLEAIETRAYSDVARLREFGEKHDPRTALVLTPLAHVYRDAHLFVVLEQVPPVLPVWERCAEEMRRWGYSVWTGVVNAEQYGVPQTRRRAILIARADGGEAKMPTPTHSRYYSSGAKKGTLDEGVLPWVSMAEALGWGMTERPFVTAGNAVGRAEGIGGSGGKAAVNREKGAGRWQSAHWADEHSATTLLSDARVFAPGHKTNAADTAAGREYPGRPEGAERVTVAEAAALQSYPADFVWDVTLPDGKPVTKTKQFLQIGNAVPPLLAEAILREVLS